MKKLFKIIGNSNTSINSFNPSSALKSINSRNIGIHSKIKKNNPFFFHGNKNTNSLKFQSIHYNLNNDNNHKILENIDSTNDIKIPYNSNSSYKYSLSTNNSNNNYYTKRRSQLYKNQKTFQSEKSQSRNIAKYNGNSLSRTTWSSFSFTEGNNNNNNNNNKSCLNQIENENENDYDYNYNMGIIEKKIQMLKYKELNDNKENINPKFNDYEFNKFKDNGIKYCIDEDGIPMNIFDIKIKNKTPVAYIIQKPYKNFLVDLDNKIVTPNHNGDYILPKNPYFIIRKYDVQFPELRVNNSNINNKNNYIRINVNESNNNLESKNKYITVNKEKESKRINNKSCNIYNLQNEEEKTKYSPKIEEIYIKTKRFNTVNQNNQMIINSYKRFKNSLRKKKRKYILVNKLTDAIKSIHLKLNTDNNNFNPIKKLIQSGNTSKNKDYNNNFLENNKEELNDNKTDPASIKERNKNDYKLFINNLNKFKNSENKLKDIKCFSHKEIKNLEFKFERKYKIYNTIKTSEPSFLTEYKYRKIMETPSKKTEIGDEKMTIESEKNNSKNNLQKALVSTIKKKYNIEKISNFDLKRYKRKRCCYSLNQFMYNNMDKYDNYNTPHNMVNTLNTFNNSFISPTRETSIYTTIKNLHNEFETNKKFPINSNIKKFNSFKYYLKPKIASQKVFHKRIKTEDMNKGIKKFKFLKFIKSSDNNNSNNSCLKPFYNTEYDFSLKNCHNTSISVEKILNTHRIDKNNICKCPYCNHLFYN